MYLKIAFSPTEVINHIFQLLFQEKVRKMGKYMKDEAASHTSQGKQKDFLPMIFACIFKGSNTQTTDLFWDSTKALGILILICCIHRNNTLHFLK